MLFFIPYSPFNAIKSTSKQTSFSQGRKQNEKWRIQVKTSERRYLIGGSDARIIMGDDAAALIRLWKGKGGEIEPEDLSANLVVQLGSVTEDLNRRWYEANTGQIVTDGGRSTSGTLAYAGWRQRSTGRVEASGAVFEAKIDVALVLLGRSRTPSNTLPNCSIICGSSRPVRRCSR